MPASESESSNAFRGAPVVVSRKPNESDEGSEKSFGVFAAATSIRPPPSSKTDASCVREVSPQAGCAEVISADFTCCGVQAGCCCSSSAAAPATCGAAMLVPSKTANGAPANSGSVDERIWPPGAATSGFSRWSKFVGPAEEKLVMTPLRPVWISCGSLVEVARKLVRPPCAARYARRFAPSRSEIIPPGSASWIGMKFGSPNRLSTSTMPRCRLPCARARPSSRTCSRRGRRARPCPAASRRSATRSGRRWDRTRAVRTGGARPAGRWCRRERRRRRASGRASRRS